MIYVCYSDHDFISAEIVYKAFLRSFTSAQVRRIYLETISDDFLQEKAVYVFLNPTRIDLKKIALGAKVILLGKLDDYLISELGVDVKENSELQETDQLEFQHHDSLVAPLNKRPLSRFDFAREWNNLGFGGIAISKNRWSISQIATSSHAIASVKREGAVLTDYVSLFDEAACSILWINRIVGLVDSVNWQLIEKFISAYRFNELISFAYLLDIPAHCDAAVTMRLDCDESIINAKPLYEKLYKKKNIPFSLAVKTSLPIENNEYALLRDMMKNNGAVLSHSVNHKVAWGENYLDALTEAVYSKRDLEKVLPGMSVHFAVSPFHSNQIYSVKALEDAKYLGFIGGIVANDPEYLISRGGLVPFANSIISHSQQCMLHGDCLLRDEADPMRVYKKAFDIAKASQTFFGFLDHPFSDRYQYGWQTEEERIDAHAALLDHIIKSGNILFLNEDQCLHFMLAKSMASIHMDANQRPVIKCHSAVKNAFTLAASMNNEVYFS